MTRTEWKVLHRRLRQLWRYTRAGLEHASVIFDHGGTHWALTRRRSAITGAMETVAAPCIIADRSPIARAAAEIAWAHHYKRESGRTWNPTSRPRHLAAARECIANARAILAARSAFHAFVGHFQVDSIAHDSPRDGWRPV